MARRPDPIWITHAARGLGRRVSFTLAIGLWLAVGLILLLGAGGWS